MDQRIINLYDRFTHGGMNRRDFLDRLATLAGSVPAAAALLPLLQNDYAQAALVADTDPRLLPERVAYDSPKGRINSYLVRPRAKGQRPAVIVIQENRGLNPHIEDVARRLAVEGFLALAPDLLSVSGGTPPDEDQARELHSKTDPQDITTAAIAAVPFLLAHPESNGNVGVVGFCFGGGVANRMAAARPELKAVAVYYGVQIPAELVPAVQAPLLLHYAELDQRVNAGITAYESALKANGKRYTIHMYPGVNHAFNNDTGGALQQRGRRPCMGTDSCVLQAASRCAAPRGRSHTTNRIDRLKAGCLRPRRPYRCCSPAEWPRTAASRTMTLIRCASVSRNHAGGPKIDHPRLLAATQLRQAG